MDVREVKLEVGSLCKMIHYGKVPIVMYVGAGISTSSNIPDFRGPQGLWTLIDQGKKPVVNITLEEAFPNFNHFSIKALVEKGVVEHVISSNLDGLFFKCGIDLDKLSEIHGNVFVERCEKCGLEYTRPHDVRAYARQRLTGRLCQSRNCDGKLKDTIVNFGEFIHPPVLEKVHSLMESCKVLLILGSSLTVRFPFKIPNHTKVVICNKQPTHLDQSCSLRFWCDCGEFLKELMVQLEVNSGDESPVSIGTMEGVIDDAEFEEMSPYYGKSMADDAPPPPKNLLNEIHGFNVHALKKVQTGT